MDWRAAAHADALNSLPRESCGLVVVSKGRTRYWPCNNVAASDEHFVIDPEDYAAAEDAGEVVGIVHSHPGAGPEPSEADRLAAEASGLEWHILGMPCGRWASFRPSSYVPPLVGRVFEHGVVDCYSLLRDWYWLHRGVVLPDFARTDEWWCRGGNLYTENFGRAGFVQIPAAELSHGDVLLMKIQSPVPNHAAIYLGSGMILHHLYGRLSSRDEYSGMYQTMTTHTLRYVA